MVDELILSVAGRHTHTELEQLWNHFEAEPARPLLWIACAGIEDGKEEHFERSYLSSILPPAFHLPEMDMPLRNTKQTLALAGLEGNKGVKGLNNWESSTRTLPVYNVPDHLMTGVEGKEFFVYDRKDEEEMATVLEAAMKEVRRRTGGAGFPLLCEDYCVDFVVKRISATALVYRGNSKESCSEVEVEEWLKRRRTGVEERVLIADHYVSRGWEASHLLVLDLFGTGLENLVMRAVGYCALIKSK